MYINTKTNEVISRQELEARHQDPLVAFPADVSDEALADFGYATVQRATQPEPPAGHYAVRGPVVKTADGYFESWVFTSLTISAQDVDAERDRRIDAGITFQGKVYQSRAGDRENIAGAAQLAFMAMVAGAQPGDLRWAEEDEDFEWIAEDNSRVPMDAQTVVAFGKTAALRKQALVFAGSNLKKQAPIPVDYTDDKWWSV